MEPKYKILWDTPVVYKGRTLFAIVSLRDIHVPLEAKNGGSRGGFSTIARGRFGGLVQGYHNLSQEGECWITNASMVYDNARVRGDALVRGFETEVFEEACIRGSAKINGSGCTIRGRASVSGWARVSSRAKLTDDCEILDHAYLNDDVTVKGTATVCGAFVAYHGVTLSQGRYWAKEVY